MNANYSSLPVIITNKVHTERELIENWCFSGNSFSTDPLTRVRVFRPTLKTGLHYAIVKRQHIERERDRQPIEKGVYYAPLNSLVFIGEYIDSIVKMENNVAIIYERFSYNGKKEEIIYGEKTGFVEVSPPPPPTAPPTPISLPNVIPNVKPIIHIVLPNHNKKNTFKKRGSITYKQPPIIQTNDDVVEKPEENDMTPPPPIKGILRLLSSSFKNHYIPKRVSFSAIFSSFRGSPIPIVPNEETVS